jgi:hypothetical protein
MTQDDRTMPHRQFECEREFMNASIVDHSSLIEAYRILGRLAQEAWANPQEVPLPIARFLLHARDHVGTELSAKLLGTAKVGGLREKSSYELQAEFNDVTVKSQNNS